MPDTFNANENNSANENNNGQQGGDQNPQGTTFNANQNSNDNGGNPGGDGGQQSGNIDVDKVLKRLDDSQTFITQLQDEGKGYRETISKLQEDLANRPTMEQIREQLANNGGNSDDKLDAAELVKQTAAAVRTGMQEEDQQRTAETNLSNVKNILTDKFGGEKVDAEVRKVAQENDMTFDEVFDLSRKNPKLVLKLFGAEGQPQGGRPTQNSVNTVAFQNNNQNNNNDNGPGNIMKETTERGRIAVMQKAMKDAGLG